MVAAPSRAFRQATTGLVLAASLAGCSLLPTERTPSGNGTSATTVGGSVSRAPVSAAALPRITPDPQVSQCLQRLGATQAQVSALPDRYYGAGCSTLGSVRIDSLRSDDATLTLSNLGPVTCPLAEAFAGWARYGADRAARQILGSPLVRVETMGSYSCRNVAGTGRRSAHASAEAIDVSAFVLADGRRITLIDGWNGSRSEREFLRVVHRSACRRFGTVLGPEYNAAHRDHFHVEISGRGTCR